MSVGRPGVPPNLIAPIGGRARGGEVGPRVGQSAEVVEKALVVAVAGADPGEGGAAARALNACHQLGEACEERGGW